MSRRTDWHAAAFDLHKEGLSSAEIAQRLGRHPNAVRKVIVAILRGKKPKPPTPAMSEPSGWLADVHRMRQDHVKWSDISRTIGMHASAIQSAYYRHVLGYQPPPRGRENSAHYSLRVAWKPKRTSTKTPSEVEAQAKRRLDLITSIVRDNPDGPISQHIKSKVTGSANPPAPQDDGAGPNKAPMPRRGDRVHFVGANGGKSSRAPLGEIPAAADVREVA